MRVLLIVVLSSLVVVAHAAERKPFQKSIQWTLSLGADGKIESMTPVDREYLPEVRKQIEPIVRNWHFTPGKINGAAAPTETTLTVAVRFDADSANALSYHVHIASAATGPRYKHVVAPHYPTAAQHSHSEGEVMLRVNFDADGRIVSVNDEPEMGADHVSPLLIEAAIDAVKQWTFRTETVAGHGVSSEALVPVCFTLSETSECQWKPRADNKPVHSGEAIALSSVVGLDTGEDARQLP
jgi:TonB family protein